MTTYMYVEDGKVSFFVSFLRIVSYVLRYASSKQL